MRKVARGVVLSVLALLVLVPIQASPASALAGSLDVTPETVDRITGSIQRYTATVTDTTPLDDLQISYIKGTQSATVVDACKTDSTGTCEFAITQTAKGTANLLVYVKDMDPGPGPCTRPGTQPLPLQDCDGNEALADEDTDDTDVVEAHFLDGELDISKDGLDEASFAPSGEVKWTAKVVEKGVTAPAVPKTLLANVDAEIESGPNTNKVASKADMECDTAQMTGTCELKYTAGATAGQDKIRGWIDLNDDPDATTGDPPTPAPTGDETTGDKYEADKDEVLADTDADGTDVVQANISGGVVLVLSGGGSKPVGTQSGLTAVLTSGGTAQSGQQIAAEIMTGGVNLGTTIAPCTTAANGQCTLNYTGAKAGVDKVRATVDSDKNGLPNEADQTEDIGVAGGTVEPDATAIAQITWTAPTPPGGNKKNQCVSTRTGAGEDEIIVGTKKNDKLCGYGGDDVLRGLKGDDKLNGGKGKDIAKGGGGDDRCKAEKEAKSCEK
jgi:hypothetical protein